MIQFKQWCGCRGSSRCLVVETYGLRPGHVCRRRGLPDHMRLAPATTIADTPPDAPPASPDAVSVLRRLVEATDACSASCGEWRKWMNEQQWRPGMTAVYPHMDVVNNTAEKYGEALQAARNALAKAPT